MLFWSALAVPGLLCAYFMYLRPVLKVLPQLQQFYAEADTFWKKAWVICGKSATMLWSYVLLIGGGILNQIDNIAATLGDPNFKEQVAAFLHSDPQYLGYFAMFVSGVTIAARLRSIAKAGG